MSSSYFVCCFLFMTRRPPRVTRTDTLFPYRRSSDFVVSTGKHLAARAQIRFTPKEELETLLGEAGLHATRWLGDWQEAPWAPAAKEIIPLGGLVQMAAEDSFF